MSILYKYLENLAPGDNKRLRVLFIICFSALGIWVAYATGNNMFAGFSFGCFYGTAVFHTISYYLDRRELREKAWELYKLMMKYQQPTELLVNDFVTEVETWDKLKNNKEFKEKLDEYTQRYGDCDKSILTKKKRNMNKKKRKRKGITRQSLWQSWRQLYIW